MSNSDPSDSDRVNLQENAHQMAEVTQHLIEAMDEVLPQASECSESLESRIKEAEQKQEKRRIELEKRREQLKQQFNTKWNRNQS